MGPGESRLGIDIKLPRDEPPETEFLLFPFATFFGKAPVSAPIIVTDY